MSIGVLSPLGTGFYFGGVINGVRAAAAAANYRTLTFQSVPAGVDESARWDPGALVRPVGWSRVAGFISIVNAVSHESLRSIVDAGTPLVVVSLDVGGLGCPTVAPDNASGVRQAVRHLLEHGHRRIAFAGNLDELDICERHDAYRLALRDHGVEPDPRLFYETGAKGFAGGRRAADAMLADGLPSTAVVAGTDLNAIGIIEALTAAGVQLPRQQAVVGFDDGDDARHARPALSTVAQDFGQIGTAAMGLLLAQIRGEPVMPGLHRVATSFVARQSCGCSGTGLHPGPADRADRDIEAGQDADPPSLVVRPLARAMSDGAAIGRRAAAAGEETAAARQQALAAFADAFLAAHRSPGDATTWQLRDAAESLWSHAHPMELRQLMALLRAGADEWLEAHPNGVRTTGDHARRVDELLLEIGLTLGAATAREQFEVGRSLLDSLTTQYEVSMDLLGADRENSTGLRWLRRTTAVAGMLVLRNPTPDDATLTVHSAYSVDGPFREPPAASIDEREFPPPALLERAAAHPETAVLVIPVHSRGHEQALLAIVAPVDHQAATGQETFHQWAALVGVAIEHQSLLQSLRRRQIDLAESLKRERHLADEVRRSEQRYALVATAANDGLWDWDLTTNTVFYSDRACALLGVSGSANDVSEWLDRAHPDDRAGLDAVIDRQRAGRRDPLEHEHHIITDDGETRWLLCRGLAVRTGDVVTRIVGSFTDVTERRELEDQLRHQALYDSLTSLPNRVLLIDRLEVAIRNLRRRPNDRFAVLFIDLDGFKAINDTFGHATGDKVLVAAAERLRQFVRVGDTAARLGGDEFVVLLHNVAGANVPDIVKRLSGKLATPFVIDGEQLTVTASIGFTMPEHHDESAEQILRDADLAMYQAKTAAHAVDLPNPRGA